MTPLSVKPQNPKTAKPKITMKKILSLSALAVGVITLASCSDFLDQTSPSELSNTTVYGSTYYTGLRVNQIYGGMGQDRTYAQDFAITSNLNSDIEFVDGEKSSNYRETGPRSEGNFYMDPGYSRLGDRWTDMYGIIEDCNDVIEGVRTSPLFAEDAPEHDEMGRYLGEALAIRAMVYFDMLRTWGDIPLKLETSQPDLSNAYLGKTDRDEIMDVLMDDLDEAANLLPWAGENGYTTEHATKGYAHALLAQIALTKAGYAIREKAKEGYETAAYTDANYPTQRPGADERKALYERALQHLSTIILEGPHKLNPSFENEWYLQNQLQLDLTYFENIFELPMANNRTGELGYTVGVRISKDNATWGNNNSTGKLKLTPTYFYSFNEGDTRRMVTAAPYEITTESGADNFSEKSIEKLAGNKPFSGIYVGKWNPKWMTSQWLSDNKNTNSKHLAGINLVKMRYSNVLLFYAECMNELAGPDGTYTGSAGLTARQALALVHERAFDADHKADAQAYVASLPADKDGFFKAIVDENAWEFGGEGFRRWDLIRWNLLHDKIVEMKQDYLTQLLGGTYPTKVYFNYTDATKTQIDFTSVTWDTPAEDVNEADYDDNTDWFGKLQPGDKDWETKSPAIINLPYISSGLVGIGGYPDPTVGESSVTVKNRYIYPIANTTIADSQNSLYNSYGY